MEPDQPNIQVPSSHKQDQQPVSDAQSSSPQDQKQEITLSSSSAYKAPLIKIDDLGEAHVHGGYIVNLFTGHTLDQHSTAVGRDMQPHVGRLFPVHDEDRFFYTGHNIDGELLDLIRMDKGVKSVREELQGRWPRGRNGHQGETTQKRAYTGYSALG